MTRRAYDWHEALVAPARAYPQLWRLISGLILIGIITLGLNASLIAALTSMMPMEWVIGLETGSKPGQLLVLLMAFGFVTIAVAVAARNLQHRTFQSVIGPYGLALRQFWRVFWRLLALMVAVFLLPPYGMDDPMEPNLSVAVWLMLLPLSLGALLIQTSAEEILFRGYMQQALAARFSHPAIWIGVPSLLFAFGHYLPVQAGENAVMVALWAGLFGMLSADLTARAGTLGPAIAVHFFNNLIAILIVSVPGNLSGLSLFLLPYGMDDTDVMRGWLMVDFAMMVVCWLVARLALRR